jgi:hypothetical protein
MMTLSEKIIALYPELLPTGKVDMFADGTITLQNDSNGKGDYIAKWEHTLPQPTEEQLNGN